MFRLRDVARQGLSYLNNRRAIRDPQTVNLCVADRANADQASMYARCAHVSTHDIGDWYWGRQGVSGALAALSYSAGAHANPPALSMTSQQALDFVAQFFSFADQAR